MIRKSIAALPAAHSAHPLPSSASKVRVTFELPSCTWACRIFVCGDFNEWRRDATPMRQERDGVWRATVDLEPNRRYLFRYLIDGNWQTDYHADGWAESGLGSENSIVDTGLLSEGAVEEYDASASLLAYTEPDSVIETRVAASLTAAPKVSRGEERMAVPQRPVRQRTAAIRHAA